jgi:hypothetical protein
MEVTTIKVGPSFDAVAVPVQSFQLDGSGKVQVSLNVPATTTISVSLVVSIWCSFQEKPINLIIYVSQVQFEDTTEIFTLPVKSLHVQTFTAV